MPSNKESIDLLFVNQEYKGVIDRGQAVRGAETQETLKEMKANPDQRPDKQHVHPNPTPILPTPNTTPHPTTKTPTTQYTNQYRSQPNQVIYNPLPEQQSIPMRTPKLEVPYFNGNGVEGWLFQLEHFFDIHETPPEQMVVAAPLYMTGDALDWFQWKHSTGQVESWTQLARDLRRRFGPGAYWSAEVALNKLVQTTTVAAYSSSFETLSTRTPNLTVSNLLYRFLAGLRKDILREIQLLQP